jgi:hypothetical protein
MAPPPYRRTYSKQLLVAGCRLSGNQHPSHPDRSDSHVSTTINELAEHAELCFSFTDLRRTGGASSLRCSALIVAKTAGAFR